MAGSFVASTLLTYVGAGIALAWLRARSWSTDSPPNAQVPLFVIDEYGQTQRIVTLQDLIEAITGEFQPRDPATFRAMQ